MALILGIDEAGRGPLAGPVAVGGVIAPSDFPFFSMFPGLNDSKRLSEKKREEIFSLLERSDIRFHVALIEASVIDDEGIVSGVEKGVARVVSALMPDASLGRVLLDGSLQAPRAYAQETIIGGDGTIPAIMLASIAAKVVRDRLMKEFHEVYPAYGFDAHKGYGTRSHIDAIRSFGLSPLHRRTFCRSFSTP
jgi:ribonuclease HII